VALATLIDEEHLLAVLKWSAHAYPSIGRPPFAIAPGRLRGGPRSWGNHWGSAGLGLMRVAAPSRSSG